MPLTKPALVNVTAGQPVTAEGWNVIVDGLSALYDEVLALGRGVLPVRVSEAGADLPSALVVAEPLAADGAPIAAIPPAPGRAHHLLTGIADGSWRLHVSADGYRTTSLDVTVPHDGTEIAVTLEVDGVRVPDLFGDGLRTALDRLADLGIGVDIILDTTGREVSRSSLPPEYESSPVLIQLPEPGTVLPAGTGRVRLVAASALRREPVVKMPSLTGLEYDEVVSVLERVGLRVGRTIVQPTS
jgi:hypothetical protein